VSTPDVEVPLSAEDRAILDLESATIVGHTCHVVVLAPEVLDAAAIRARIGSRIDAAPELRYRLGATADHPVWTPAEDLDLADHILDAACGTLESTELPAYVATRFGCHLDRRRPLWAIDVVPLVDGRTALVWRIHHALADGTTSARLSRTVLFDERAATVAGPDLTGPAVSPPDVIRRDHVRRRAHLVGFLRREFAPGRSPFDGVVGTRRDLAFTETSLPAVHAAAHAAGATLNDAVLSVVAGALRRWIEQHAGRLTDVRVRVPVSLHTEGEDALNRDSWFTLPLPLHIADPVTRIRAVHQATTARKEAQDAAILDVLMRQLSGVAAPLQRFAQRVQASPREFAVAVSNVVGPRQPVAVLGRQVSSVWPIAEIGQRHALRLCAMSHADTLAFGCLADPALVEGVDLLADGIEREVDLLVRTSAI
jgi:diacylglycerol O-acyltransferase / wax synthase